MNKRIAENLRVLAERYDDPHLYDQAAAEFEAQGRTCAAARCRDRARNYRKQETITDSRQELMAA